MTIDVPIWRTVDNFWKFDPQPIPVVKTFNRFIFQFSKGLNWNSCFWKNGNKFMVEGIVCWILVLTRRFIPNNRKKCFMKYQNRSSKNPLKRFVVRYCCFVGKQRIDRQIQLLRFCFYILNGWRDTPTNLIWNLEESVGKSLSIFFVIGQGSENITKYCMNTICIPSATKYESMHWGVSFRHRINYIFLMSMQLKILAKFIKLGIFQEITKWVIWLKRFHRRSIIVMLMTGIIIRES